MTDKPEPVPPCHHPQSAPLRFYEVTVPATGEDDPTIPHVMLVPPSKTIEVSAEYFDLHHGCLLFRVDGFRHVRAFAVGEWRHVREMGDGT